MENATKRLTEKFDHLKKVLSISKKMDEVRDLLENGNLEFTSLSNTVSINVGNFWNMSHMNRAFDFYPDSITHFVEMHEICFDKEHERKKELMSAYKFLKKFNNDYKNRESATMEYLNEIGL